MESWHSYPSSFAIGHRALTELFLDPVLIEEKVDGSQFSFGRFEINGELEIRCRSKGATLNLLAPEKMFTEAIETVKALEDDLEIGWTYRAEYLKKPKHNALAYERIPNKHLILFDINTGHEAYLTYEAKAEEAARLGLEVVPKVFSGMMENIEQFRAMLDTDSILGGQKIEGVVCKNYWRFGQDKKILIGKFVSEAFKEVHAAEWKSANPTKGDIIEAIIYHLRTPARWNKAVQHLRDAGQLQDSPRDIGLLIKEAQEDIIKDSAEDIAKRLYDYAKPQIMRGVVRGLPEWYKEELLKKQFENG